MTSSLYAKYGGFSFVHKIVVKFYEQVLESDRISHYFENSNMETLIEHQTQFISSLMGGAVSFTDERIRAIHKNLSIDEESWNEVMAILSNVLNDFSMEPEDSGAIINILVMKKELFLVKKPLVDASAKIEYLNLIKIPIAIYSSDNHNCMYTNSSFNETFNLSKDELELYFIKELKIFVTTGESVYLFSKEITYKKHKFIYEFSMYEESNDGLILIHAQDISELKRTEYLLKSSSKMLEKYIEEMYDLAHTDQLTTTANRRALFSHFNKLKKEKTSFKCVISIIDIDNFKKINDTYGHEFGDYVLKEFCQHAESLLSSSFYLYRIGGEEFCLLEDCTDNVSEITVESSVAEVQSILKSIQEISLDTPAKTKVNISFSAGVSECSTPDKTLDELLNDADKALYYAKKHGRSCVIPFSEDLFDNRDSLVCVTSAARGERSGPEN